MNMISESCPKCGRTIKGNSQNTLTINMTLHLEKHKWDGDYV